MGANLTTICAALLGGSALPSTAKWLWRLITNAGEREATRVEGLEDLVDALRRALDKGRLREDALAQVLGVLIFGLKSIERLSPSITDAIDRAIVILEGAQSRLQHINDGGDE